MKLLIVSLVIILGSCNEPTYFDPNYKVNLPDAPSVQGAGKLVAIPKDLDKLDKKQTNELIVKLRASEAANAKGYNARGRAWQRTQSIYNGSK